MNVDEPPKQDVVEEKTAPPPLPQKEKRWGHVQAVRQSARFDNKGKTRMALAQEYKKVKSLETTKIPGTSHNSFTLLQMRSSIMFLIL